MGNGHNRRHKSVGYFLSETGAALGIVQSVALGDYDSVGELFVLPKPMVRAVRVVEAVEVVE